MSSRSGQAECGSGHRACSSMTTQHRTNGRPPEARATQPHNPIAADNDASRAHVCGAEVALRQAVRDEQHALKLGRGRRGWIQLLQLRHQLEWAQTKQAIRDRTTREFKRSSETKQIQSRPKKGESEERMRKNQTAGREAKRSR